MTAPEPLAPTAEPRLHLVDLQYEEVAHARTEILKRESMRMRSEGWAVQVAEDHLIATRREGGHSQIERTLLGVGGFLALAYAATVFLPEFVASLPVAEPLFLGAAALLGAAIAYLTRGQAAGDRRVSVGVDGHGRPFMMDVARRDL